MKLIDTLDEVQMHLRPRFLYQFMRSTSPATSHGKDRQAFDGDDGKFAQFIWCACCTQYSVGFVELQVMTTGESKG
jgi:hypothetical protein